MIEPALKDKESVFSMKTKKKKERGILTLDFIFSMMAVYAITMIFSILALTLMVSSVVQYMSYSMARSHISGDLTVGDQQDAVEERLNRLLSTSLGVFIKANDEEWFKIESASIAETHYDAGWGTGTSGGSSRQEPYGVAIKYTSLILKNLKLPLIGSPSDGASGDFGSANMFSFLYREPTTEECLNFNVERWRTLKARFNGINSMPNITDDDAGSQADNGC